MLISSHPKRLAGYFHRSESFFYILVGLDGQFMYVNPLFQQKFKHIATDFYGMLAVNSFIHSDAEKFNAAIEYCLQNNEATIHIDLQIKGDNDFLFLIRWEFSAGVGADNNPENIQAIGFLIEKDKNGLPDEPGQELKQSELFYRNLFANSIDGVLLTDEKGIINFASSSITKVLGYDVGEILGKSAFQYVHPDDHELASTTFYDEVRMTPRVKFINVRLRKKTGEWIWCMVRGHNMLDNPHIDRIIIYFTDDTQRKGIEDKLKESERLFRNLIYNLNQGVLLLNEKAEIIICNHAAQSILGIEEEMLIGSTAYDPRWDIICEDGSDFPAENFPSYIVRQTKKSVRDIIIGVLRETTNERIWVLANADPNIDINGNVINIIISFTDITEQKKLSQILIEQEIHKQKQLTQATIDGQEKERQQIGKELHDNINQHLTTTRLYMEVAREKTTGEALEMINLSHKTLADIINEIRHLSQSLVPPTLGDIGLIESIHDLCDSLRRAHKFTIDFYCRYFNDTQLPDNLKLMLFRIIQEQVNNIIRHANAQVIKIKLQSDAENIFLMIADNGKGFDPASYKKGLGLSNIRNRATLFDGKVEIESSPGKGCALTVIIPFAIDQ